MVALTSPEASAASPVGDCSPVAIRAIERRTPLAAYYELKLALIDGRVVEWASGAKPRTVVRGAVQVAVGKSRGYAIDTAHRLLSWAAGAGAVETWLDQAVWLAAGDSGVFAIRCDGSLWFRAVADTAWQRTADAAVHAWVGDGADYYVDPSGNLFVRGLAHRGQYGDGRLAEAPGWNRVGSDAVAVIAHTGHALYLRRDGAVLGTGGNRFGPLSSHGIGDKADRWGVIFEGATAIATGSRHSMALRADGSLWIWGALEGLQPKRVLPGIAAMAGAMDDSIELGVDGRLWQWRLGDAPAQLTLERD